MRQSCKPFNIPSLLGHASWEHLVEDSHYSPRSVSRCPVLLKLDSLRFNTKSLQTLVPEMCKAPQCSGLKVLLLPCLPRLQRNRARSPQKMLHHTKQ
jgi:hypothetical protein